MLNEIFTEKRRTQELIDQNVSLNNIKKNINIRNFCKISYASHSKGPELEQRCRSL